MIATGGSACDAIQSLKNIGVKKIKFLAIIAVPEGLKRIQEVPQDASARKAAREALNGYDPTGGCLYFFNPSTAKSKWIWSKNIVKTVGKHVFAK